MKRWMNRWFSFLGKFATVVLLILVVAGVWTCATKERVPASTIVELRLERPMLEYVADDPLANILQRRITTVRDVIDGLDKAASDDRVKGLIAYIGGTQHGMARTQELRDAVLRFRESGKPALAFAETFGEFGPGNQGYYLATAFDEIWLQPSGDVGLTGLMSEAIFVKDALEKLDVEFQGDHRKEYKNALNMFKERRFTPAHKEATQAVMEDMFEQMVAGIAESRGMKPQKTRDLIDRGPFLGKQALDAKLVDGLGYHDEVLARVRELAEEDDADLLYLAPYLERAGRPHQSGDDIALIYGVGSVVRGPSGFDPLLGGPSMGSDTVASAFRAAIDDDDVEAILFRVDSPGGSYVASDTIWRETVRAREAGKPVIVSMGNVAGSGGYFVAMNASKIVAQPGTITGSIGVLGGKPVVRDLFNGLGITWDSVETSKNASMWSMVHPYDESEWKQFQQWLDRVYLDFTTKAAEGRGMELEALQAKAKGRIWSGQRALEHGLVDELGGMARALQLAKEAAGIDPDDSVELRVFPPEKGLLDRLLKPGRESSESVASTRTAAVTMLDQWQPMLRRLRALGLAAGDRGVLTMRPVLVGP